MEDKPNNKKKAKLEGMKNTDKQEKGKKRIKRKGRERIGVRGGRERGKNGMEKKKLRKWKKREERKRRKVEEDAWEAKKEKGGKVSELNRLLKHKKMKRDKT